MSILKNITLEFYDEYILLTYNSFYSTMQWFFMYVHFDSTMLKFGLNFMHFMHFIACTLLIYTYNLIKKYLGCFELRDDGKEQDNG
jgi:hypothetical protein